MALFSSSYLVGIFCLFVLRLSWWIALWLSRWIIIYDFGGLSRGQLRGLSNGYMGQLSCGYRGWGWGLAVQVISWEKCGWMIFCLAVLKRGVSGLLLFTGLWVEWVFLVVVVVGFFFTGSVVLRLFLRLSSGCLDS